MPSHLRWFSKSENVKRMPSPVPIPGPLLRFLKVLRARWEALRARVWDFVSRMGLRLKREADVVLEAPVKERPVARLQMRRMVRERQRMMRETLAGRECHVSMSVPRVRMVRFVVTMWRGGSVRANQIGVRARSRMKSAARAGDVVDDVAVRWVERKSVS